VYFKEFVRNKKNKKFLNQKEYYTNLIDIFRTISQDSIEYEAIIFHYCDKYAISLPALLALPPSTATGFRGLRGFAGGRWLRGLGEVYGEKG
jgi:hypothetical protein